MYSLNKYALNREERGVVIILSPRWFSFYEKVGSFLIIIISRDLGNVNGGRYIKIKLQLNLPFKSFHSIFTKKVSKK